MALKITLDGRWIAGLIIRMTILLKYGRSFPITVVSISSFKGELKL